MNLSDHMKLLSAILALAMSYSCIAGDGILNITGHLVDIKGATVDSCVLELHLAKDGTLLHTRQVSGFFEVDFTIAPWSQKYYLVAVCPHDSTTFKSAVFKTNGTKYTKPPLDLGKIILKPMN